EKAAIAMDSDIPGIGATYNYARMAFSNIGGFPGYPYLSMLATRAEYRAFAAAISTEMIREWITLNSSDTAGESTKDKITQLEQEMVRLELRGVIQKAFEHDTLFGRGQVFIDIDRQDRKLPLVLDPRTIK